MGSVQTQVIRAAAQLGLADHLKDGPRTIAELAETTGTDASALGRIMRALADLGLVGETGPQQFASTALGKLLETDAPDSLRAYAILVGEEWLTRPSAHLQRAIQTGRSVFEHLHGATLYDYTQRHAEALAVFDEALTSISTWEATAVRDAYDLSAVHTLVDVGGGRGRLLAALLAAYPALHGVLLDLPAVVSGVGAVLEAPVACGRCRIVAGDFLVAVPEGGDLYLLKRILPAFDDRQVTTILRNCRDAMAPGARVLVADPDTSTLYGSLFDLSMLTIFGGRLRTEAALRELFASAGLAFTRSIPTRSTLSLVEGQRAG
jgi:hypothetical protein